MNEVKSGGMAIVVIMLTFLYKGFLFIIDYAAYKYLLEIQLLLSLCGSSNYARLNLTSGLGVLYKETSFSFY